MRHSSLVRLALVSAGLLGLVAPRALLAQSATVVGRVTDETGAPMSAIQIVVNNASSGLQRGTLTRQDGRFQLPALPAGGPYRLEARGIGYRTGEVVDVQLGAGETRTVDFVLQADAIDLDAIQVFASRAKVRETPVAFTNVPKAQIAQQLGSRDVPMVLSTTPGVYVTQQGGGAGDSRINIRGFSQRNVAVMINGVPVNDMENGWVYWSNWDGLGDATSSIQVQRGIGASGLAVPSIGGTMNVLTDAAALKPGMSFKQEAGTGDFLKSTLSLNSGLINDRLAVSFVGVRKTGEGFVDRTWTDAWGYFGALSYQFTEKNRIQAFVVGAPQRHGQRRDMLSIADWDADYARELGITATGANLGLKSSVNWGRYGGSAELRERYWGKTYDLRDRNAIDENVNYYHKPQANVNWYWTPSDRLNVTNVFYLSLGRGGGSGTLGSRVLRAGDGTIDWDGVLARNVANVKEDGRKESVSILRNSTNEHTWYGWVGTVNYDLSDNFELVTGIDARNYRGEHSREVRNLLGGDYFVDCRNKNTGCREVREGDKVAYNNDGLVRWYGAFAQLNGRFGRLTTNTSASLSQTGYKRIDYFLPQVNGKANETDWESFDGYKLATGANYNLSDAFNLFGSVGYISKPPLFNGVFSYTNQVLASAANETITSGEVGVGYSASVFAANLSLYNTKWDDRVVQTRNQLDGKNYTYILHGLGALHRGVELDFRYQPSSLLELNGAVSLGDWFWTDNVNSTIYEEATPDQTAEALVYAKDLKVGDAAQTQFSLGATVRPTGGSYLTVITRHNRDYYANFAPERRADPALSGKQPWKVPAHTLVDLNAGYDLPVRLVGGSGLQVTVNVFNLLDETYISDARDGSGGDAASARVFFGMPRTINLGLKASF